jgi:hypothetical protein
MLKNRNINLIIKIGKNKECLFFGIHFLVIYNSFKNDSKKTFYTILVWQKLIDLPQKNDNY